MTRSLYGANLAAQRLDAPVRESRSLRRARLHPTYGDDFDGAGPDAAWTTFGTAPTTALTCDGRSWGTFAWSAVANGGICRPCPSGDFTLRVRMAIGGTGTTSVMIGPTLLNDSGDGFCVTPYNSPNNFLFVGVTGGAYNGSNNSGPTDGGFYQRTGAPFTVEIAKSGTSWTAKVAAGSERTLTSVTGFTSSITPTKLGIGSVYSAGGSQKTVYVDYVDIY